MDECKPSAKAHEAARGRAAGRGWGAQAALHDAVDGVTSLVWEGNASASRGILRVARALGPAAAPVQIAESARMSALGLVLQAVRVVNRGVQRTIGAVAAAAPTRPTRELTAPPVMEPALPLRSDVLGSTAWLVDAGVGLLNGAVGDWLHEGDNELALPMVFRVGQGYVPLDAEALAQALPAPSERVVVFVHGLGTTDWSWSFNAEQYHGDSAVCFGTLLQRELGITPVYVRYNTGRPISDNGRELAAALGRFVDAYPGPVRELILVGHSMGGLVVRSACHLAEREGMRWAQRVRRVIYIGAPHYGAPLAKLAHLADRTLGAIDLPSTLVLARILGRRSAGIRHLRFGTVCEALDAAATPDGEPERPPLLSWARHSFIFSTITRDATHPAGRLLGDLLVRAPSASGATLRHEAFPIDSAHLGGVWHHHMQNHPAVYDKVLAACRA